MKFVSKKVSICFLVFSAFVAAALLIPFNNVSATNSAGLLSAFLSPDGERAGWINVTVRDSRTGQRVSASLRSSASGGELSRTVANDEGRGTVAAKGRTDMLVESDGYAPLETYFGVDGNALDITVYLDPIEIPAELRPEAVESKTRQGHTLVHGSVFEENGSPLTAARLYFRDSGLGAETDEKGYFELSIPTPSVDPTGDIPGKGELIVEKNGREVYRYSDMLIPEGAVHLILDTKADGVVRKSEQNKLTMSADVQKNSQSYEPPAANETDPVARPSAVTVPPSIRVGSNCPNGRTTCTVFTVYSIDTYVRFGLDDEWIASWNANSLKAGAIAFRSYGAYHVYHPINAANYDICNTTSCQVCDPTDSATSTNNAAIQTTGSIVTNATSTDVLFSEYSAENNLGGCPDGFTGNNTTWPCLADPVDAGQAFFGHGRGMCQWGSQRWSINQGKDFVWIVNHYYNANGNPAGLRNGIFQMGADTLLPPPNLAEPGNQTAPGTTVSTLTPTFQWGAMSGADGYSLYVSKFNGATYDVVYNSETALGQPISGTSFVLPSGILVVGGEYRWNMSAHIPAGYGTPNTFRNYFKVAASIPATVSGKVNSPAGIGLRNVIVTLADAEGNRRFATTSSFGLYSFSNIVTGQGYTITVTSKRFRFAPKTIQINGDLSNEDFVGLE